MPEEAPPAAESRSTWALAQSQNAGWIRRMFAEGERLRAEFGSDAVLDLSLGQPLEAPPEVHAAFARAGAENFALRHAYIPNLGYPELRSRLAAEDAGFPGITSECIAVTVGAAGAMVSALRTFADTGAEVLGFAPYFPEFPGYCSALGMEFVPCPTGANGQLEMEPFLQRLSQRTQAVIVNSPNNPSGHVFSAEEWQNLVEALRHHNRRTNRRILLLVDEAYFRLHWSGPRVEPLRLYEHTVLARSFSKDMGLAGERIGYLLLHPGLATAENQAALAAAMRSLGMVNAPATAQRALLQLVSLQVDVSRYKRLRDIAVDVCKRHGLDFAEPEGGIYLWLRSPRPDAVEFVTSLAQKLVLTAPGVAFGVPDRLRLCFSAPEVAIRRGIETIAEVAREAQEG